MSNQRKSIKWLIYATGVILLLILGLAFFAPILINTVVVKEKLRHDLSRKISGTVTFRALKLSLFPVPRLIIEKAAITLPQKMEATIASLKVYPQIIPLLRGKVKISKVHAQDPAITVFISDRKESQSLSVEEISAAISALVGDSAGLTVTLRNGRLALKKVGQVPVSWQQVDARMVVDSQKNHLTMTLEQFKVAFPRIMLLSAIFRIQPSSPRLSLEIKGKGLAVGPLRDFALYAAREVPSVRNVCDIVRDGNVPAISFHSQGDSFEALGAIMNIEIKGELEGGMIHVPGPGLDFTAVKGQCLLSKGILRGTKLTGRYGKSDLQQALLKLNLKEDDAPFHLDTLFKADLEGVLTLLQRLVKDKTFSDELRKVQSLSGTARGRLVLNGRIGSLNTRVMVSAMNFSAQYQRIPFPVTIKGGEFTYDQKQISVKDLTGTVGQTAFSDLAARMDQSKTPDLAVLSGKMRIHAAEIIGWLSSVEQLRPSLKNITAVSGTITLSSLTGTGSALSPRTWIVNAVGATDGLTVTSPLFPSPLFLTCRNFSYDRKGLSVKDLSATVGRSSVVELDAQLQSGNSPNLKISSARAIIDAGEMVPWLASHEKIKSSLRDISAVSGTIVLSEVALQGPLSVPKEWRFKTTGTTESLVIGSSSLPGSLTLRHGKFTLSPGRIVLEGVQSEILDTAATVSGSLMVSSEGLQRSDVSLDAETGPRGMQWIKAAAGLPSFLRVQQGLSLSRGRIVTSEKEEVSFQGTLSTKSGQTLGLDLRRENKELKITKLDIEDAVSRASITFGLREKTFDITFSGRLDSSTLAALTEFEQMPDGHLAGDFTAHIRKDRPKEAMARGRLSGEKLLLPWKTDIPLHIDALSVNAEGSSINVLSSRLHLADVAISSRGMLTFGKDGLDVNMDVEADRIEWKYLKKIMEEEKLVGQAAGGGTSLGMPVRGNAKISVHEFVYDKFTISPLQADLAFSPGRAVADIRKASLCGISIQGGIDLAGKEQTMDLRLAARDEDLGPTMACLSNRDAEMTGRFSLDGSLTLGQKATPLLRRVDGNLSFQARDGRINKSVPLSKIFSLLSVTEYFRGLPDLRKEGFSYSTVTMGGDIHQGRLLLKEAIIDGSTMTIMAEGTVDLTDRRTDLTVLASPFKTLDTVFSIIPGKKGKLRAPLISMAVKVTGDIKDPDVSAQPLSGISRGLISNMARVLKAPIRIIELLIPQEKK